MKALGFCTAFAAGETAVSGDFPALCRRSKWRLSAIRANNEAKSLADEDTMNIETTELKAVEQVVMTDETVELLALSVDDLDLVAGGAIIGNLL